MARLKDALRHWAKTLGEILYGMTIYDMVMSARRERSYLERLFILSVFGDLLGIPVLPPYYSLRLLPYVVPTINRWRYQMLRERDLVDLVGGDAVG